MFSIPFKLERSIVINKPADLVYESLGDFNQWGKWSPWIIQEPECPVTVTGDALALGHHQAWNGKRIGSGYMDLIECKENQYLAYDLVFVSPWKSQSKTQFKLEAVTPGEGHEHATKVTWLMQGTLPIFLFFMKKMMSVFVGRDYERGLKMLKEWLEDNRVSSSVDINGITEKEGYYYIGIEANCDTDEIPKVMKPTYEDLMGRDLPQPDAYMTINLYFNPVKKKCAMIAAFAYKQKPDVKLPVDMVAGVVPDHKALEVVHNGSYKHLANGWVTLMNYMRFKKIKADKKIKEYEVYLNSPEDTAEQDLKTAIYAPVK